jgi:hypothetical protein
MRVFVITKQRTREMNQAAIGYAGSTLRGLLLESRSLLIGSGEDGRIEIYTAYDNISKTYSKVYQINTMDDKLTEEQIIDNMLTYNVELTDRDLNANEANLQIDQIQI